MSKILYIIFLSNFLFAEVNAQWYIQNEIPILLNSVKFINPEVGFILGRDGLILKTTDGGNSWQEISSNTNNWLEDIFFIDGIKGWITGSNGTVLITSDGGDNWNNINTSINTHLRSIYFLNDDFGWVSGDNAIYRTTNGGLNWEINRQDSIFFSFFSITFIDSLKGIVCGGKLLQQQVHGFIDLTTNGGVTWTTEFETNLGYLSSILFVEDSIGYAVGENGAKIKSTDYGNSWFLLTPGGFFIENWESAFFINKNVGWVAGGSGRLIDYTTDGGINWTRQLDFPSGIHSLYSIFFSDSITGWAVGVNDIGGEILKTTNGGITFTEPIIENGVKSFALLQNYPNPFNPSTTIKFALPVKTNLSLNVYSTLGEKVAELFKGEMEEGYHEMMFNASGLSSGVYFYKIESENFNATKKLMLLK